MTDKIRILFDVKQKRPACVLLQAVAGGEWHKLGLLFDAADWLVAPTPDMQMVSGTLEQWRKVLSR